MSPPSPRHFSFRDIGLDGVVAHGGVGEILTRRVMDRTGGACNFIDLTIVPPGCSIGKHRHAEDNEEIYVFLSGTGRMLHLGRQVRIGPGDVVVNPPGGMHGFWNTGDCDVRMVVIEVPAGRAPEEGVAR